MWNKEQSLQDNFKITLCAGSTVSCGILILIDLSRVGETIFDWKLEDFATIIPIIIN